MSAEYDPYFSEKESMSAMQPKEKDVEKIGSASEEGTLIKSAVDIASNVTKDDAKTIQDEKDALMEIPQASTEKN